MSRCVSVSVFAEGRAGLTTDAHVVVGGHREDGEVYITMICTFTRVVSVVRIS